MHRNVSFARSVSIPLVLACAALPASCRSGPESSHVASHSTAGAEACGEWRPFTFGEKGEVITIPLRMPLACDVLRVTDAGASGDRFDVRVISNDGPVASFSTDGAMPGQDVGENYDTAYRRGQFSSGQVELPPGFYRVRIEVVSAAGGGGAGAISLVQVPCDYGDCVADFNGDRRVNLLDKTAFKRAFESGSHCADIDGDGKLTIFDELLYENEYNVGC